MTRHREIKKIIYKLKRQWGTPARIYRESVAVDVDTGVETPTTAAVKTINRAILLPRKIRTEFSYDLSYIAANKNFTYGGFYATTDRLVLIDAVDLGDYVIAKQDYIDINNKRHVIADLDDYDEGPDVIAYMLKVSSVKADLDVV
jgi:hypothetical protein